MQKIAISVGDINGIGIEIALKSHETISKICNPVYFINNSLLQNAADLLKMQIPKNFVTEETGKVFKIKPATISKKSGQFSYESFQNALNCTAKQRANALVTLPINKKSWTKAGIKFVGHTDALSGYFKTKSIMMLGCEELFVALFTDHIALKDVSNKIGVQKLVMFFLNLYKNTKFESIGVLGFNPHAGDNGVIGGKEEIKIKKAIKIANIALKKQIFFGPLVPDAAFTKNSLSNCNRIVAMYHDQGLAPLKSLYFDKSVNVSLNLPIIRTSVDHGTAFDIAYQGIARTSSYIEAVKTAIKLADLKSNGLTV